MAARNSRLEAEAQQWIEEITGIEFQGSTFEDSLRDGVILCKCVRRRLCRPRHACAPVPVAASVARRGGRVAGAVLGPARPPRV